MYIALMRSRRSALVLILAFGVWAWLLQPEMPYYARIVIPAAGWILGAIAPHHADVSFSASYPRTRWRARLPQRSAVSGSCSFSLLTYNLALYLALVTAVTSTGIRQRLMMLATGMPALFALHVVDLWLTVVSGLLTALEPEHYAFYQDFDLRFVLVKFYQSFSAMTLKALFPFLVTGIQLAVLQYGPGRGAADADGGGA